MAISKFIMNAFGDTIRTMGITEKEIASEQYEIVMGIPALDRKTSIQLEQDGLILKDGLGNSDIIMSSPHQYFLYKKRPVLVYIRDQLIDESKYYNNQFNPFHICFCESLQEAQNQNRYKNRYVVTYNTTGRFLVNFTIRDDNNKRYIIEKKENQYENLHVCQTCLKKLNWHNFARHCGPGEWWKGPGRKERLKIVGSFIIKDFFSEVKSELINHKELYGATAAPHKTAVLSPRDKQTLKERRNHRCEKCGKYISYENLYIHHKDHNEGNNNWDNLMVVCMPCHAAIHRREGGYILDD